MKFYACILRNKPHWVQWVLLTGESYRIAASGPSSVFGAQILYKHTCHIYHQASTGSVQALIEYVPIKCCLELLASTRCRTVSRVRGGIPGQGDSRGMWGRVGVDTSAGSAPYPEPFLAQETWYGYHQFCADSIVGTDHRRPIGVISSLTPNKPGAASQPCWMQQSPFWCHCSPGHREALEWAVSQPWLDESEPLTAIQNWVPSISLRLVCDRIYMFSFPG